MFCYILLLLFSLKSSIGFRLTGDVPTAGIKWPPKFHLKGEQINLKADITEPMELWYNGHLSRSRIDYYGGLVKKYYTWSAHYASVKNVYPVSTEIVENEVVCTSTTREAELHDLLPQPDNFEYIGEKEHEGHWVQEWHYDYFFKKQIWKELTMYTIKSVDDFDVPVQFVMKSFYNTRSALTAHIIVNYFSFNSTVEDDALDSKNDGCNIKMMFGEDFHKDVKHLHPMKDTDVNFAFHSYKKHHNKNYKSEGEHEIRKSIFQQNWEMVTRHNRQNLGYKLELNHFADLTSDEVTGFTGLLPDNHNHLGTLPFPHSNEEVKALAEELPEHFDMRVEGIISAVKNQAHCGSCWAFSSTAAVEGALARSNGGRLLDLSEQSMIDCSWGFSNRGCTGGILSMAFRYLLEHGIPLQEEYGPYLEQDGLCHTENTTLYNIRGFSKVTRHNPEALKVALHKYGPVAVSIRFNEKMRFYASGVFYDPDCNTGRINHGVAVIGYGVRDGTDYWIVKNSHGMEWGEAGYMLIAAADNNCFVLEDPAYPIV